MSQADSGREPLVLVVDDLPANVQLLGQMLSHGGYEVMPANSGEQALARARARVPDLVLLDLLMPGTDGVEVCRLLRADPRLADVPVIFLTAATERDLLVRAFETGAVDYLTKPFVVEELFARVRTHVNLKRANDHLRLIAREREDVTAIVAHDLKNPIANIRFAAQMLQRPGLSEKRRASLVDDIVICCDDALAFIQRYLARRAETERLRTFTLEPVDLGALIERTLGAQAVAAEMRGVELRREGPSLAVLADAATLRNVLQNLLSNALRFAPAGSIVEVRLDDSRSGYARIYVLDRGPGVPETERQKLFQRFARISNHSESDSMSTGLGLAIAKSDVEQMNGFLWYEPRGEGGSVFAFELPLAD